jgi:hypothetical protein
MRRLIITATAALLALGLTVPADATGGSTFRDKRGDSAAATDIVRYQVINGSRVGVRVWVRDLSKKAADIQWWMQPVGSTLSAHAYATLDGRTKMFLLPGQDYMGQQTCAGIKVRRSLKHDWAELTIPRSCIGTGALKARVRVQQGGMGVKGDSAPSTKGYTRAVPAS